MTDRPGWQQRLGVFYCGFEQIELYVRAGNGGDFYFIPEDARLPRMKIGLDCHQFKEVVSTLLHEAMEFQMTRHGCRFDPSHDLGRDHSAYLFVMDHPQFSDCCAKAAEFVVSTIVPLGAAWRKRRAGKK